MGEYGWMWISGSTTRWHDEMNQSISKQPDRAGYQKTHASKTNLKELINNNGSKKMIQSVLL